jgi:hypothetical protein
MQNVSDVRQIEIPTAEPLVSGPSCLEDEITTAKLKIWCLRSRNSLILFGIRKNCLIRVITMTNNYHRISLLSTSYKILLNILLSRLSPSQTKLLGIIVSFDATNQLLIRFSAFIRYWRQNRSTVRLDISYS